VISPFDRELFDRAVSMTGVWRKKAGDKISGPKNPLKG
jgi:hypothetical protein